MKTSRLIALAVILLLSKTSSEAQCSLTFNMSPYTSTCNFGTDLVTVTNGTPPFTVSLDGINFTNSGYSILSPQGPNSWLVSSYGQVGTQFWIKDFNGCLANGTSSTIGYTSIPPGTLGLSGTPVNVTTFGGSNGRIENIQFSNIIVGGQFNLMVLNNTANTTVYSGPFITAVNNLMAGNYSLYLLQQSPGPGGSCVVDNIAYNIEEPPAALQVLSNNNVLVSGFTQLGLNAPLIKMKLLSGTTSSSNTGSTIIQHGITNTVDIIAASTLIVKNSTTLVSPGSNQSGENYSTTITNGNITVELNGTNSNDITSKPITILLIYKE